jgi:hypothetical protein
MIQEKNRRKQKQPTDKELYKKPDIKAFIEKERREKELKKLKDIHTQSRLWRITVFVCGTLNIILLFLAFSGMNHE